MPENHPWWNNSDAVGGAAATIILVALAIAAGLCIMAGGLRLAIWIFG